MPINRGLDFSHPFKNGFRLLLVIIVFYLTSCAHSRNDELNLDLNVSSFKSIPDFSYAGFNSGNTSLPSPDWPVVRVDDFGAVANDGKSDTKQIQRAIQFALGLEGAIVLFSPGRYILEKNLNNKEPLIKIHGDRIIIKGAGVGRNGTELNFPHYLKPKDPMLTWSTPHMVEFYGSQSISKGKVVTKLAESVKKNTRKINVVSAKELAVGDFVVLNLNDSSAVESLSLKSLHLNKNWKGLYAGEVLREFNEIIKVEDNTLTLANPVLVDMHADLNWEVRRINLGSYVGIENLKFVGGWDKHFAHHKNAFHDSAWSALKLENLSDSWVRNIKFEGWNETLTIGNSYRVTASNISSTGKRGHFGIHIVNSHRTLVMDSIDCGPIGQHHAFSVSSYSSGTVFYRTKWPSTTTFDAHARFPHSTLIDYSAGGFLQGPGKMGGAPSFKPNHLDDLIFWNFTNKDSEVNTEYNWWKDEHIPFPIVIGWQGTLPNFLPSQLKIVRGLGKLVSPKSLYVDQLSKRLGFVPDRLTHSLELDSLCN